MPFRLLSLGEGAYAHRYASNAFRLQSVVSIALKCEIFIAMRYEQLCVLCLVSVVNCDLCVCVCVAIECCQWWGSVTQRNGDLSVWVSSKATTCSYLFEFVDDRGSTSRFRIFINFCRRAGLAFQMRENTTLSVRNGSAAQPLIRIWMSSYLFLDFFLIFRFAVVWSSRF